MPFNWICQDVKMLKQGSKNFYIIDESSFMLEIWKTMIIVMR